MIWRCPNGLSIISEAMKKGAEGSWFCHSPPVVAYIRSFRIFEPSDGCKVKGIWLAPGRQNELTAAIEAGAFNELMMQVYDPVWTEPRLAAESLITVLLDGTAETVVASFKNQPSLRVRL